MFQTIIKRELFHFHDDGNIPNSKYPVIVYRNAFCCTGDEAAVLLERRFAKNNWTNGWRAGIFTYRHYHSTAHEVLGIYGGTAMLEIGGIKGRMIQVGAGDVIILPAGTGHKNLNGENDVQVVGAYADGRAYDMLKGDKKERLDAMDNIAGVPLPVADALTGYKTGLYNIWQRTSDGNGIIF